MNVEIRPARIEDVAAIADRLRQADRDEVMASHSHNAEEALRSSLEVSTAAWTGLIDDVPVCMFGVAPVAVLAGRGAPWLLGTDLIEQFPRTFLRRCRGCVARMLAVYPLLENFVHEGNTVSKQWLAWLGFELAEHPVTVIGGAQFRYFRKEKGCV